MKKIIVSLLVILFGFNMGISLVHAGVLQDFGNSVTTRFKNPGFDLRNNMMVGDANNNSTALIPGSTAIDDKVSLGTNATDVNLKDNFLGTIQNYLFTLVAIVAIGMFIYTGFRLFSAHGDEKEYTQAWKAFAYTIVGLVIIPLSFVLVKVVLGFTF